jgi:pilus assembly protein Flp/PilA
MNFNYSNRIQTKFLYNKNKFAIIISLIYKERRLYTMLFLPREEGQGLVEYALILVLIAVVVIAILLIVGPVVGNVFSNLVANL